ncbi:hypothetical protein H312_02048 [Anncaliia algerae PRA339]|uniref:Uncharacterized protein n=1 Tax=Anncaliia algerae PRA339 TaxID=1288291 RepID=A0A059F0Q0_9MICR|nr:hypothetical protein H312_02048 [Anncaliia algerae PRA339]
MINTMCLHNFICKKKQFKKDLESVNEITKKYEELFKYFSSVYKTMSEYDSLHEGFREKKYIHQIKKVYKFYILSEIYFTQMLNYLIKNRKYLYEMKSWFVTMNNVCKMFYMFDNMKFSNCSIFTNLNRVYKNLQLKDKILAFMTISMPMGHLILSSFMYEKREVQIPRELSYRKKINITNEINILFLNVSNIGLQYNFEFLHLYFLSLYNFFSNRRYCKNNIRSTDEKKRKYFSDLESLYRI